MRENRKDGMLAHGFLLDMDVSQVAVLFPRKRTKTIADIGLHQNATDAMKCLAWSFCRTTPGIRNFIRRSAITSQTRSRFPSPLRNDCWNWSNLARSFANHSPLRWSLCPGAPSGRHPTYKMGFPGGRVCRPVLMGRILALPAGARDRADLQSGAVSGCARFNARPIIRLSIVVV